MDTSRFPKVAKRWSYVISTHHSNPVRGTGVSGFKYGGVRRMDFASHLKFSVRSSTLSSTSCFS